MNTQNLQAMKGRSFPSKKYGAWVVDRVSETIDGRSRLVTADLKGEQWLWTQQLVNYIEVLDVMESVK